MGKGPEASEASTVSDLIQLRPRSGGTCKGDPTAGVSEKFPQGHNKEHTHTFPNCGIQNCCGMNLDFYGIGQHR